MRITGPGLTWLALTIAAVASAAPPKVNHLFPAGGQRGQSVAVAAVGEFANWPGQIWADRPGITATAEHEKGKLKIEIAADAVPGVYWLRLADGEGAAALRPFVVGALPEVLEAETNDLPEQPQAVEPRVVVNGKLAKPGDVDGYRLELQQGQTLVASVQGHTILGSPMDCVLQVCELIERPRHREADASRSPQVEAFVAVQNHDAIGLDPQIEFTAPRDGNYLVRIFAFPSEPNSTIGYAGGDGYVYRLTLTTGGFIDHALPLAIGPEASSVRLEGWNIPAESTAAAIPAAIAPADPLAPPDAQLERIFHPEFAGGFELPRVEHTCALGDDTATLAQPQAVSLPVTIGWRLASAGDVDAYAFQADKNQRFRLDVEAHSLGFPTDAMITVLDDAGKVLAEADDNGRQERDPELDFTAPEDGRYRVLVRDLAGRGGPRIAYRLTIEPVTPDFSLSLTADSFVLEQDKPLEIQVNVAAQGGFREAVEIQAIGLPAGVTAEPVKFTPTGDSGSGGRRRRGQGGNQEGPGVKLVLKADPAAIQPGGTPIRIEGRTAGDKPLVRSARFSVNLPLAGSHHAAWLTVRK